MSSYFYVHNVRKRANLVQKAAWDMHTVLQVWMNGGVGNKSENKPELGLVDILRRASSEDSESTVCPLLVTMKEVRKQNGQAYKIHK